MLFHLNSYVVKPQCPDEFLVSDWELNIVGSIKITILGVLTKRVNSFLSDPFEDNIFFCVKTAEL